MLSALTRTLIEVTQFQSAISRYSGMNLARLMRVFTIGAVLLCVLTARAAGDAEYDAGVRDLDAGDYAAALKAFGLSAREGNSDAQYQLGIIYMDGLGVRSNAEEAAYWFRKAAQNGHMASQFEIGHCFATGSGVQQDSRIAAEWYWRAAEQGDPDAAFYLARMYRDGVGMKVDIEKARYYFRQASEAGLPEATDELSALPAPAPKVAKASTRKSGKGRR